MLKLLSPERIARQSARRPWIVLSLWSLLMVAAFFGAGMAVTDNTEESGNSESNRARTLLHQMHGESLPQEIVVVRSDEMTADSAAYQSFVTDLSRRLGALEANVASVVNHVESGDPTLVSEDGRTALIVVTLTGEMDRAATTVLPVLDVLKQSNGNGFSVLTVGDGSSHHEIGEAFQRDLERSEMFGLPAALIVLIVVFGAVVAAGIPLAIAFFAIFIAFGVTGVISTFVPIGDVVTNMIVMIGLAVGIDYSLFIVERFREERARGLEKHEAIAKAASTATRAVVFSGSAVIIGLAGLLIIPSSTFHGLALGAMAAVIGAVLSTLVLLPAILSLLGDKVNAIRIPGRRSGERAHGSGFFGRLTRSVMAHPVIAMVAAIAVLLAAAAPVTTIKLGSPGVSGLPQNLEVVQAWNVLEAEFGAGRLSPTQIVVQGDVTSPAVLGAVERLASTLQQDDRFSNFGGLMPMGESLGVIEVYIRGDSQGNAAQAAVQQLRAEYIAQSFAGVDVEVLVGGDTAMNVDYISAMNSYLPIVIGFVLSLSFLLLTMVFRSIVIPVKAILMNLLSVGAAYGLVVAVFQHGIGAGMLGFQTTETITAWLPVFLFAVLFGLSMDYHVFLLSRIQERFLETGDNRASVAHGLQSTAHIITGAAAILVVVFGTFAMGSMVELQQMGFGLAVAVFVDATIIRSVLVPASMELLGNRNWYLPNWLGWLPRLNVEGSPREHAAPAPAIIHDLSPAMID